MNNYINTPVTIKGENKCRITVADRNSEMNCKIHFGRLQKETKHSNELKAE
jgi:hypothetical protein